MIRAEIDILVAMLHQSIIDINRLDLVAHLRLNILHRLMLIG